MRASIVRQGDGSYRITVAGLLGALYATDLAQAMALAYRLAAESQLQG